MKVAEGIGVDLYRSYVPDAFKRVFWTLKAEGKLHSIQITSNSPVMPWELIVPEAPDGTPDGFLGISYRLARWAPRDAAGQVDRPLDRMAFTGVATVAPAYDNDRELPFQQVEVDALSKLDGFRLVGGDFSSFEKLVGEVSTGFIHFSGHGAVNDPGSGAPVFAIQLLDQALDPTTWRALTFAPRDRGNPFFFFNACDTGAARSLGGFVQGWGPAVLASGASGFIGGMWPLTDRTAAAFSTSFYGDISEHMKQGPVYVAEVLQDVRRKFYETGDPTYLAYTFYGNANLQVVNE
jgi:CHAT domain-containing protein